ncbi:SDR family oxidoreductase [Lacunimicrobium album]
MELKDRVIVVTGGGSGIGRAMCQRFAKEQPKGIIVADIDPLAANQTAEEIGGIPCVCDLTLETNVKRLIDLAEGELGPVDLYCANAGLTYKGGCELPDPEWQRLWQLHVMSTVYAARLLVPGMLERKSGYFMLTSSAAGILTEIGSAAYSVTKHATVALAEWLSIHYARKGIGVSCLCPAGVDTGFLDHEDPIHQFLHMSAVTPEQVADLILNGIRDEKFLLTTHPEIDEFFAFKTRDYPKYLSGFQRLVEKLTKRKKT